MPKRWQEDSALVDGLAENLMEMLPVFPKQLLRMEELAHSFGMPMSHLQVLILLGDGELTVGELSRRLRIAKPNITPMVDTLQTAQLVERVHGQADRRLVSVRLLPAGRELLAQLQQEIGKQVAQWNGHLSRSEVKSLTAALGVVIRLTNDLWT